MECNKWLLFVIKWFLILLSFALGVVAFVLSIINTVQIFTTDILDEEKNSHEGLYLCADEFGTPTIEVLTEAECNQTVQAGLKRALLDGTGSLLILSVLLIIDMIALGAFLIGNAIDCMSEVKHGVKVHKAVACCVRSLCWFETISTIIVLILNVVVIIQVNGSALPKPGDLRMRYYWHSVDGTTRIFDPTNDYAHNSSLGAYTYYPPPTQPSENNGTTYYTPPPSAYYPPHGPIDHLHVCRYEGGACHTNGTLPECCQGTCQDNVCPSLGGHPHFTEEDHNKGKRDNNYYNGVDEEERVYRDYDFRKPSKYDRILGLDNLLGLSDTIVSGQPDDPKQLPDPAYYTLFEGQNTSLECFDYYWHFYRPGGFFNGTKQNPGVVDTSFVMQNCAESDDLVEAVSSLLQGISTESSYQIPLIVVAWLLSLFSKLVWEGEGKQYIRCEEWKDDEDHRYCFCIEESK